jgi:diguanylate cyclase (GGDEF)-like protein/PAS domain S-box-containing protein
MRRGQRTFCAVVAALGLATVLVAGARLDAGQLGLDYLALAAATLLLGSRLTVTLPTLKSELSLSEVFLFLAVLLHGPEPAVLLAAAEGWLTSLRFTRSALTRGFNAAVMALAVGSAALALGAALDYRPLLARPGIGPSLFLVAGLLATVHYAVNSILVAVAAALKTGQQPWQLWRRHYAWAIVTYLAAAATAVLTGKLLHDVGAAALALAAPVVATVHFAYRTRARNMEAAAREAAQARQHIAELQAREERFRAVFDQAASGMALVSPGGRWLRTNRALCDLLGRDPTEMVGREVRELMRSEDATSTVAHLARILGGHEQAHQVEVRFHRPDRSEVWTVLSIARIRDPESEAWQLAFQVQDITARKRAEEQLVHDAFHDSLTGLPNRALFLDHLKLALDRARRTPQRQFAVLFLDLDRFKLVNDSLGHAAGDALLVEVAHRLRRCIRPGDTLARLGGDEFTVLLEDLVGVREAIQLTRQIEKELGRPCRIDGRDVFTSVSAGIAPGSIGYDSPEDVLRDADTAMYRAKSLGKNRHEVFDIAMHDRAMNLLRLETDLRQAIERHEFVLHYQPIVSLATGALESLEALVRWQHPEHGFVSPLDFIPIAEESGLIIPIGRQVLDLACRQARSWRERYPERTLTVAVNLSGRQLDQPGLVEEIEAVLAKTGCPADALKVEVTESAAMNGVEQATVTLGRLRRLGVATSIDDFGTGYSSLAYLHNFPASAFKIDRSFVARLGQEPMALEIVRTILGLAKGLRLAVVAEGVETHRQVAMLRELGCHYGQGYFFCKPLSADDATQLLDTIDAYPVGAGATVDAVPA